MASPLRKQRASKNIRSSRALKSVKKIKRDTSSISGSPSTAQALSTGPSGPQGKEAQRLQDIAYPRPQLRREKWLNLDGPWKFAFDDQQNYTSPIDIVQWPMRIEVPYAFECERSGIGDTGFHPCVWYEREFELAPDQNQCTFLHFGAVDYFCRVWVNGQFVGSHEGGHTPFTLDISNALDPSGKQTVTVCALDDPQDLAKPRGKQDWQLDSHSIWYPRTTGIWQTVWVEQVPSTFIHRIRWTPHLERWEIGCEAFIAGNIADRGLQLKVTLSVGDQKLISDSYEVIHGEVHRRLALSDPGIDDYRNELLWCPERPTLIHARVELWERDRCIDRVESYTALRSVGVQRDRFMLNGRPYYLRLVLDQGYWPETYMTAPSEAALRRDIELTKQMGFNGVRKHQKVEDPRYLYWADKLGLLVWAEMPSAYRFTHESVERLIREWMEFIDRDYNHPSIIVWVPFNESWGVPDLAAKPAHQNCVQALYHLTHTMDQTRPVIGNDGWEATATDIIGIHDYDPNPQRLLERYGPQTEVSDILGRRRPAGRMLTVEGHPHKGQPFMLTEFGGIAYVQDTQDTKETRKVRSAWGYDVRDSSEALQAVYTALLNAVNQIELFSGFCYTQLTDTFQEANGLLYADRTPKFPLEKIREATRGIAYARDEMIPASVNVGPSPSLMSGSA